MLPKDIDRCETCLASAAVIISGGGDWCAIGAGVGEGGAIAAAPFRAKDALR